MNNTIDKLPNGDFKVRPIEYADLSHLMSLTSDPMRVLDSFDKEKVEVSRRGKRVSECYHKITGRNPMKSNQDLYKEAAAKATTQFIKHDSGKPQWSLVPWEAFAPTVDILTQGAEKYAPDNWKLCTDVSRYKDALLRHLMAYMSGEEIDKESGQPHLNHVICNCLFLEWFRTNNNEEPTDE